MNSTQSIIVSGGPWMVQSGIRSTSTRNIWPPNMSATPSSPSSSELPAQLLARDLAFAKVIWYLQETGQEAHTDRNGKTTFQKKLRKKRRTGQGPATK